MKTKNERYVWALASILALIFILAIIYMQDWDLTEKLAMGLSSSMAILVFSGFGWYLKEKIREREKGIPSSDERTVSIEGIIFKYSFIASFWILLAIAWFNILSRYLDRDQMPADISLVMALSLIVTVWVIFSFYINKRFS